MLDADDTFAGRPSAERCFLILAQLILVGFLWHVYRYGENSFVLIHDNLDSVVVWLRLLREHRSAYFDLHGFIPNILNGVPILSLSNGLNIGEMTHLFFSTIHAIVINETLSRFVAFWGMYRLLKRHIVPDHPLVSACVGFCFALLPFWPPGFLSVSGQPFVLSAFLNFRKGEGRLVDWLVVSVFPFCSSLVFGGFAMILMLGGIWLYDAIRQRRVNRACAGVILALCALYLLGNYRLVYETFLGGDFVSHRVNFQPIRYDWGSVADMIGDNFLHGQYHAASLQGRAIVASVLLALLSMVIGRDFRRAPGILLLLFACLGISLFFGLWKLVKPDLPHHVLLRGFQWERVHVLHPLLWHLVFALALSGVAESTKRVRFGGFVLVTILVCAQSAYAIDNSDSVREEKGYGITFSKFFAEPLFSDISAFINLPRNSYRVGSIGLHPAIAQYNGFYTVDAYLANYSLDYKKQFREIIAPELDKSPRWRRYFDDWGSRCYLFSSEVDSFMIPGNSRTVIRNLQINTQQFKKLGGRYIFSAVPILNERDSGLTFRRVFFRHGLPWRIWLYEVSEHTGSGESQAGRS